MNFREEHEETEQRVRVSLDNNARKRLHLSCRAMEMILPAANTAADLCFTCPLSPCQNIYQREPGVPG